MNASQVVEEITQVAEPDWSTIRVPDVAVDDEAAIAHANARGRDAAIRQLGHWFPTVGFDTIPQTTDATTLHVGKAIDGLVAELEPEKLLEALLTRRSLQPPQLRMARDGVDGDVNSVLEASDPQPLGRVGVRPAVVARAMSDGFTMVFDGVDLRDARSIRLAEVFERAFAVTININGYLSLRPQTSFGAHWDTQEVLILQLLGRKQWAVHQPVALSMTKESYHRDAIGARVWQGKIAPGDVLYVPRGWAHEVTSIDELSYHYTITIPRLHGVKVLNELLGRFAASGDRIDEPGQAPMTAGTTPWPSPFDENERSQMDDQIARSVALGRLSIVARPTQRLSRLAQALSASAEPMNVRCACAGGWLVDDSVIPDTVRVSIARSQFDVHLSVLDQVMALTDGLAHRVTEPTTMKVARRLLHLDVLEILDDPLPWPFTFAGS